MKLQLEDKAKAYDLLKNYDGPNGYIQRLRNEVYCYKKNLNDFHFNFIFENLNFEPRFIGKVVKIKEWWGLKKQEELKLDFTPRVIEVGWYMGQAMGLVVFYGRFRKSQEKGMLIICTQDAFITNFWLEDYHNLQIDFTPYNTSARQVMEHQKEAVKFLVLRKKCILADEMGGGKTTTSIIASLVGDYKHILIICPQSVKETWRKELNYFVKDEDITIVSGSKWDDKKYTIINYDILDNFYIIPKQKVKEKTVQLNDEGEVVTEYHEKEITARSVKIIKEAMAESQLFQAQYDLIIIDEAHKLSNNTSGRFKLISDLVKRSNPKGIFELTGTMITNSAKNLYNLLKIIDVPVTRDWNRYMERYCGVQAHYQKKERDAYTAMFLKGLHKKSWYDLTDKEKEGLNQYLEKKRCKKFYVQGDDQNMDELREIIKPYYLRRLKTDFVEMVPKTVKCIHYAMTNEEKESYHKLWQEYLQLQEDKEQTEKHKQLIEVSLMRQWLADKMISRTVSLVEKCIATGRKVVIFCSFDNEIDQLRESFKDKCVYHNGKISEKKKNIAVDKFQNDDNVRVFIGNIQSASTGITLIGGTVVVFNSFSFTDSDNSQAEDRVWRIGQKNPCTIYYQSFNGTYFDRMLEIVSRKKNIAKEIIITEKEKTQ